VTTAALVSAALAVLLWPRRRADRRRTANRSGDGPQRRGPDVEKLPVPALAAGAAAAVAAAVSTLLVALLAAVLAALGARAWLARRRADRVAAHLSSLTEGLGALAAELRSGRSLAAATDAAVAACGDERSGLFLARAIRAPGSPQTSTAGRPEDRVLDDALRSVSAAVLLSARTGCSLAGVLGAVEDDLRARRRARDELRAATAGPGASALVLAGLPALGLAMGSGVGADPWRVLTTTGAGQALLVAGVTLELTGVAWSRRLIRRAVR
jgi:tight adherence protein B